MVMPYGYLRWLAKGIVNGVGMCGDRGRTILRCSALIAVVRTGIGGRRRKMHLEVKPKYLNGIQKTMWVVELEYKHLYHLDTQDQANGLASNIAKALKLKPRREGLWTSIQPRKSAATLTAGKN
jgi:hypothetical protein